MREDISSKKRIVLKIGTSSLTFTNGAINTQQFDTLSCIIADLVRAGKEVVIVTSGAVHSGAAKLSIAQGTLQAKQAAAAVGQVLLMNAYEKAFSFHQLTVAQFLVTKDALRDEKRKLATQQAIGTLLGAGMIPVINENDAITDDEIGYGDNDRLSADIAVLAEAELLVLLSDIDGLYSCDPRKNPDAVIIPCVHEITPEINSLAQGSSSKFAKGGMITKIMAAKICSDAGIETIITNSANIHNVQKIMAGEEVGTLFVAHKLRKIVANEKNIEELNAKGAKAKEVSLILANLPTDVKNQALKTAAQLLQQNEDEILAANALDILEAKASGAKNGTLDRLMIDVKGIQHMIKDLLMISSQEDPIGEMINMKQRPNGLSLGQKRVPLGVIAMIYEARPEVTTDSFGLCLKTGNALILRGTKDTFQTNNTLVKLLQQALVENSIPAEAVQLIENTDSESLTQLMKLKEFVDVIIPRGSSELIKTVKKSSVVPVIETGAGNCHVYVDKFADLQMAIDITFNSKTQRVSTCNTIDSLLVHKDVAKQMLPGICSKLKEKNVEIRGDQFVLETVPGAVRACDKDWETEFLDYILAVKVVDSLDEAIAHINKNGSRNSEAIITENYSNSQKFLNEVDAAAVYVNASTRFTDGYEFGFGAEIGISTQKIHARGPMGLKELTSTKYIIYGTGQIRKLSQN